MRVCTPTGLRLIFSFICFLTLFSSCQSLPQSQTNPQLLTDRDRDGLTGNVKAALTADIILVEQNGQWFEGQQASSTSVYDAAGKRISQTPFRVTMPNGYAITQHELLFDPAGRASNNQAAKKYVLYDNKGNVTEKGSEENGRKSVELTVQYEFDAQGNWIKRSLSRLAERDGKQAMLPSEVSYRHLVYFDSASGASHESHAVPVSVNASQLKMPIPATQETLDSGRAHFLQRCAACHGENGKGQTDFAAVMPIRPGDLTSQKIGALSEGEIYSVVSEGIKSSGMPGFKGRISDEARWQIALYVKELSRNQSADKASQVTKASPSPKSASAAESERRYTLTGKVVSIEREMKQVIIEHEEVKGYMEAMTMPFPINDEKALGKLKKGNKIQATLIVGIGFWRLENVVIK